MTALKQMMNAARRLADVENEEIAELRRQLEIKTFEAEENGRTIREQQRQSQDLINSLENDLRNARRERDTIAEEIVSRAKAMTESALAEFSIKLATLRTDKQRLMAMLEAAIVKTPRGWRTLHDILTNGEFRDACPNCGQTTCEGCVRGYGGSLAEQNNADSVESWQRTWSGRID